jgi:glycerol-3-phosphate dehydrogenase
MAEGSRILFAIPWGRRVILGTTDTDYDGPIDDPPTEPADIEYILGVVGRAFPGAGLGLADVRATWAGLRPLLADRRGRPSDISRAHQIRMPQPGWLDVAGGKLTTYRLIAEQAVDRLVGHLGRKAVACRTAEEPLLPDPSPYHASAILPPEPGRELVEHYAAVEWAVHLDDVMIRRTGWHYYLDEPRQVADRVARWMAALFAWDATHIDAELARYRQVPP